MHSVEPKRFACGRRAGAIAALCLMGALGRAQPDSAAAGPGAVLVLYSFPTKANREFCEELRKACQAVANGEPLEVTPVGAMGDLEGLSARLSAGGGGDGPAPVAIVCLDAAVARCARPCPCPKIVITESRETLSPSRTADPDASNTCVLETLPRSGDVLKALGELEPIPRSLGIVHTQRAPGADRFLREFLEAWKGSPLRQAAVRQCVLDPGGCRNAAEVKQALDQKFADLAQGDLLLALPDTNTLKFAYAIRSFAQAKKLGFISLGEFGAEGAAIWLSYPAPRLASACAAILAEEMAHPPNGVAPRSLEIAPDVQFDDTPLRTLGFSRAPAGRLSSTP